MMKKNRIKVVCIGVFWSLSASVGAQNMDGALKVVEKNVPEVKVEKEVIIIERIVETKEKEPASRPVRTPRPAPTPRPVPQPIPAPVSPPHAPKISTPHPDVKVVFKDCIVSGQVAILTFFITNVGQDITLQLSGSGNADLSRAYDDVGNAYGIGVITPTHVSSFSISKFLPQNISQKVQLQISGLDASAKQFQRVQIRCSSSDIHLLSDRIIFPNIILEK